MAGADDPIRVYHDLADRYAARQEPQLRDRYLVLAADAARTAGARWTGSAASGRARFSTGVSRSVIAVSVAQPGPGAALPRRGRRLLDARRRRVSP